MTPPAEGESTLMPEGMLRAIDEAFSKSHGAGLLRLPTPPSRVPEVEEDSAEPIAAATDRASVRNERLLLAFFAVQFLWGALLFVPGAQAYRGVVRALPYLASLTLLFVFFIRRFHGSRPKATGWVVAVLLLLVLNLSHPTSQLAAGLAQCVFQLSITAPLFWAYKAVDSPRQLERLLTFVFLMNLASATLGVLQAYAPGPFMPPQFNSLGVQLNALYVESLTYVGRDGQLIVRPPGLTDQPGGAAIAGALTALLGLGLTIRAQSLIRRLLLLGAVATGMAAIYLTQVRSVLLMVIGCVGLLALVAFRQGQRAAATWVGAGGAALVVAAFLWASSVGGDSVDERFLNIRDQGAFETYQETRGGFLSDTVDELLDKYPLGAGVGRWGMMNTYFADPRAFKSEAIHAELQLTGWLLDGGWPMWVLYGGAILASLFAAVGMSASRDPEVAGVGVLVLGLQVFVTGLAMAGPIFNTQLGILFWTVAAALHGAAMGARRAVRSGHDT